MRSLETRTKRIFNNLIKQNEKLAADFVLKQCPDSVQCPEPNVQRQESSKISPTSSVQSSVSIAQLPEFSVQGSESNVQSSASRVQRPESRVQRPTLASRVKEFRYALFIQFVLLLYWKLFT